MAYLARNRSLDQISIARTPVEQPVAAGAVLYEGAFVTLLNAGGFAVRAGTASAGPVVGVAHANAAVPVASGDTSVILDMGLFSRPLDATHPPVQTDVGHIVYASDDQTISRLAADGPMLGVFMGFTTDATPRGIVLIDPLASALYGDLGGLAITGALSTVADAPAKAVLTSIVAGLVARGATNSTT